MARRMFPNEENRLAYSYGSSGEALESAAGATCTIYTDSACTSLADIRTEGGGSVPGSVLTIAADSRLPLFQGPDGTPFGTDSLYALLQGRVAPGEPLYARYDDRLDMVGVPITCTSSTRPSSPVDDQIIYETDTNRVWRYNLSLTKWLPVAPNRLYTAIDTTSDSAATSGTTELTLLTTGSINVDSDGVTPRISFSFYSSSFTNANDSFELRIYRDASAALLEARMITSGTVVAGGGPGAFLSTDRASGGASTYSLRVARAAGAGTFTMRATASRPARYQYEQLLT